MEYRALLERLAEAWVTAVKYDNGEVYDIIKNPSRAEVFKMIYSDKYGSIRALASPTDIWVFSADICHYDAQRQLGFGKWDHARFFIDKDGPYLNQYDDMAISGTREDYDDLTLRKDNAEQRAMVDNWCGDHPILRRIFPGYRLGIR